MAIVGAGPYGLSAAAHLRAANVETRVFGEAMEFWSKQMPEGMLVRSIWEASHLSDPRRALTLDIYVKEHGLRIPRPMPLSDFIHYGRWFQQQVVPDLDPRRVVGIELAPRGFRIALDDGEAFHAQRVVVATGIGKFFSRPAVFEGLPAGLVSHTSDQRRLSDFRGKAVAVIGGGQSALECAALLYETGAAVEVIARQPMIRWLDQRATWLKSEANPFRRLLYPPSDVGPPGLNWIVATPALFRQLPRSTQEWVAYRSIRPAGSGWLVPRLRAVTIRTGRHVVAASASRSDAIHLTLDDGSKRRVDHVLLGTGYRVDVSRHSFLGPGVLGGLQVVDGYPELRAGLESSVRGLHFLGAPAARSFGPINRFVTGTAWAAPALTRAVVGA
ncbi:MAG TPA: FAD-dependent oxidoreductase [Myxococcaceae bacterium]